MPVSHRKAVRAIFGATVRAARKRAGLSQFEVGRRLGWRQYNGNTVSMIERGACPTPRLEDLSAWATALDVPVTLLYQTVTRQRLDELDAARTGT